VVSSSSERARRPACGLEAVGYATGVVRELLVEAREHLGQPVVEEPAARTVASAIRAAASWWP
jgi:hypothetical protein